MAYESSHGRASCKCPRCGKFAIFDSPEYILTGKEETSEEEKLYEDWFSGLSLEKKRWYFNIFKQMEQYPLS